MLNSLILAADETTKSNNGWIMYVVIGVVLVLMIVLTIVPQKKRQKEQQNMMNSLCVGTKLMTVVAIVIGFMFYGSVGDSVEIFGMSASVGVDIGFWLCMVGAIITAIGGIVDILKNKA